MKKLTTVLILSTTVLLFGCKKSREEIAKEASIPLREYCKPFDTDNQEDSIDFYSCNEAVNTIVERCLEDLTKDTKICIESELFYFEQRYPKSDVKGKPKS